MFFVPFEKQKGYQRRDEGFVWQKEYERRQHAATSQGRASRRKTTTISKQQRQWKEEKLKFIAVMTNAEFILPTPLRITS